MADVKNEKVEHVENVGGFTIPNVELDERLVVTEAEMKVGFMIVVVFNITVPMSPWQMNSYTYLLCLTAGISGFLFGYDTSGQQYSVGSCSYYI